MNKIKLGLPGKDQEIEYVVDLIGNMGSSISPSGATSGCPS